MDTGSCVSILSKKFYDDHLTDTEIKPLTHILQIECADGNTLPYLEYVEVDITATDGIPQSQPIPCMLLVTPDTTYTARTPVLLGTNILNEFMSDCKTSQGERYLQTARLTTPWYLTFRAIAVREKQLKRNNDRIAIVKCGESSRITIGPNESKDVRGYTDREIYYQPTCAILQECEESSLPSFIDITPSVVQYKNQRNTEVLVNVTNLTTNTVTISPKAVLCELQPVTVDASVFNKTQET